MISSLNRALVTAHLCVIPLILTPAVSQAGSSCLQISGKVRLDPDASCKIATLYPGPTYLGKLGLPNACFSVQLTGLGAVLSTGNAGLTSEGMITMNGGIAPTPAMVVEYGLPPTPNEFGTPETRRFVTARSVLALPGGKLYTADAGVLGLGISTEQLIITGGDGFYKNASGAFYATGNLIGNWGNYNGKICYPSVSPPPPPR